MGCGAALERLGWASVVTSGGDQAAAIHRLRDAVSTAPVMVGPVEFGLLLHHPGMGQAIGSDHYVVVTDVRDDEVVFHDPHGFPYATLPIDAFAAAWRGDTIDYTEETYVMRTNFARVRDVDVLDAMESLIPDAVTLMAGNEKSNGGAAALERLAELAETGMAEETVSHLTYFAIRVGVRRLCDASHWLAAIGRTNAAALALRQAELVGSLQYVLTAGDQRSAAPIFRRLAPTYADLAVALQPA